MLSVYLAGEIHSDWRDDIIQHTKKNDLNVNLLYTRGQGSTNNAIAAGGLINSPTNTFSKCTETWDGTSWSIEAALNVAGRYLGVGGNADGDVQASFTRANDPNFRIQVRNESSSNNVGASQGKFGLFYATGN